MQKDKLDDNNTKTEICIEMEDMSLHKKNIHKSTNPTKAKQNAVKKNLPQDIKILHWCPAKPVLPHGEKVPL